MLLHRCVLIVSLAFAQVASANWPAWRGPDANTVAPPGDYPVEFGPGKNERWSVDLPGAGTSTPVVWGDAVFVTAVDDDHNLVCCYGLDGQERWSKELGTKTPAKHRSATGGNPSPVVDAERVIVYYKSGDLTCLDHDGQPLWDVNLQKKFGQDTLWWDLGTSPVLTSAGVCVAVMQAGDSFLVTLDLDSGKVVWKEPRQYKCPRESDQAYTTPAVVKLDGTETIVTWGADHLTGHDAKTGQLLWEQDGFNPNNQGMWRVIASSTISAGVAYIPYGRAEHFAAVRLGKQPELLWNHNGIGADVPCPVVHDGKIYILSDNGYVHRLETRQGYSLADGALPRSRSKYFSSPLLAGDHLYCLREDGVVFVADVSEGVEVIAENDLGDDTVATPVPVKDGLLIRTRTRLFLFSDKS